MFNDCFSWEQGKLPASIHVSERAKDVYLFVMQGRPILHPRVEVGVENGNDNNNKDTTGEESDASD